MEIVRNDHAHGRRAGDHIVAEMAEKQRVNAVVSAAVENAKRQNKRINDRSDDHDVITRAHRTLRDRLERDTLDDDGERFEFEAGDYLIDNVEARKAARAMLRRSGADVLETTLLEKSLSHLLMLENARDTCIRLVQEMRDQQKDDDEGTPPEYRIASMLNSCSAQISSLINTIYSIKHKNGAIRRVNINIAATTVDNYRLLKEAGIGTYILFQETYHKESYLTLHPTGPKHDYNYHTEAMDRAMEGGVDDVGIGVLFGLDKYRYEFAGLLMHAEHLEAAFGVGPHTISVPRLRHADDINADEFDNGIDDDTFAKIVACIRIAVPYTGMIISTRESQKCRERVLHLGVSQISGGSRTSVGGYCEPEPDDAKSEQFDVSDTRTLDEVVRWLMEMDYIPSFCTACYREGRTGDRFMSLCKSGQIQNCCHPNALMTLKEYLMDYASPETKAIGDRLIAKEVGNVPNEKARAVVLENLRLIEQNNRRDFRF